MAEKRLKITVPLSPIKCYEILLSIGSQINDWKVERSDKSSLSIVFRQGSILSIKAPIQISASITPLNAEQTQISFLAKNYGLADPLGFLDNALTKLMEPFQIQVTATITTDIKENLESSQKTNSNQININGNVSGSTIIIGNENQVQNLPKKK